MRPILKNILIISVLAIAGAATFGYKKVVELQESFYKIAIAPFWVKNLRIGLKEIKFDLDIVLKNSSSNDFYVTGSVIATLTRLHLIYKGTVIGTANVNLTEIAIPAFGQTIIKDIPITVSTGNLLNNVTSVQDFMKNFSVIGFVDILGTEYQIGS